MGTDPPQAPARADETCAHPKVSDVVRLHGASTRATVVPPLLGQVLPLRVRWHDHMRTESVVDESDVECRWTRLRPPRELQRHGALSTPATAPQALTPRSP